MNLNRIRTLVSRVVDGVDQRSRHAAIAFLTEKGLSSSDASAFVYSLYHKIPSLKADMKPYVQGVVRWFVEEEIDLTNQSDLSRVNTFLKVLRNSPARDALDRNFYSEITESLISFKEALDLVGVDVDSTQEGSSDNHTYRVVQIKSFEDLLHYSRYAPKWCISSSSEAFNSYSMDGTNKVFLCLRDDFTTLKPIPGENNPYDDYGFSMIVVILDVDDKISSVTSRWNADNEADNFLSASQLEELLGEETFDEFYRL